MARWLAVALTVLVAFLSSSNRGVDAFVPQRPWLNPIRRCLQNAGFEWCPAKNRCINRANEPCVEPKDPGPWSAKKAQTCQVALGYMWCPSKNKCLRRWEEPCAIQLPIPHSPIGGKKPGERCLGAAGYEWCPSKYKCLRRWEEHCDDFDQPPPPKRGLRVHGTQPIGRVGAAQKPVPEADQQQAPIGGKKPGERCLGSAGYEWCPSKDKCLRRWEEYCSDFESVSLENGAAPIGGMKPGERCLSAGGYEWCPSKNKCLRRWEEECSDLQQPVQ